ncbi:hypothetical protein SAMN04487948_12562 [Halogranum amylolyticum]|uniref:Uncharacterized protein n=1 Tax=Halogranum amylolyticum TaxID=660520 RepID=A0A1H8W900_9EURY|nr:hypothetical protein [Halogranum amylolyticum]SEP24132.1 hypothetical protein SAMN04487948_12562 [Halogranum amylolyticum]
MVDGTDSPGSPDTSSPESASRSPATTRRTVLALVGSVAAAGCTDLPVGDQSDRMELDGAALRSLAAEGVEVPQTLPVNVASAYLGESEQRARELLGAVPSPLTETEIPNGVVRARVVDARGGAADALRGAAATASPYQRLLELQRARAEARFVDAAWAAVGAGLAREDVVAEASDLETSLAAFREERRYVGDDPVRSVVVHDALEGWVRAATNLVDSLRAARTHQPGDVLDVGELAETAERVRVNVTDGRHVYGRYTASLADDREMRPTFESTRDALVSAVRERTRERFGSGEDYPEPSSLVDRDVEGTPAERVLRELARELAFRRGEDGSAEWVADGVVRAHEQLVRHRALDAVLADIAEGDTFAVERVADVETARADAVDAIRAALSGSDVSPLTRNLVPDVARRIAFGDRRLADLEGMVRATRVGEPVAEYVVAAAMVEATPPVSDRVASELRTA